MARLERRKVLGSKPFVIVIAESDEESEVLDEVFGDQVGDSGLISAGTCECRLSDGYAEHYVKIHKA